MISVYEESKDLVLMGGYTQGQDLAIDKAHASWPYLEDFIKQGQFVSSNYNDSKEAFKTLMKSQGLSK